MAVMLKIGSSHLNISVECTSLMVPSKWLAEHAGTVLLLNLG